MMRSPILLTGCARSGTSMTAGIIDKCGAFGGRTSGPNQFNKKGMFENRELRDNVLKPFLYLNGADPKGQKPLPDPKKLLPIGNLRSKVETIMKFQGCKDGDVWYYKGAKLCLIWPTWYKAFPDAQWIIVRRADEDIVYSCMRTTFMSAYHNEEGWQGWVDAHKRRFEEMKETGLKIIEVWPSKFVEGDFTEIKAVIEKLGLRWKEDIVREFISPELWRTKDGIESNTN